MKLRDLLRDVPVRETHGNLDVDISAVVADSRLAVRGSLFVAIPGLQHDGAKFISSAIEKGAAAVVSGGQPPSAVHNWIRVDDPRATTALRISFSTAAVFSEITRTGGAGCGR